jgi:four helix bundle protein
MDSRFFSIWVMRKLQAIPAIGLRDLDMTSHKKLVAWQVAITLVEEVYRLTKSFPTEEKYGLRAQINRSAVSVPANIAEGVGRKYPNEAIHFFFISRGSLYELETLLEISCRNRYFNEEVLHFFTEKIDECMRTLNGLIRYFKATNFKTP